MKLVSYVKKSIYDKKVASIWFLSYLVVLIVPIALSILAYIQNDNILLKNITVYNNKIVSADVANIENKLDQIVNVGIQVSMNTNFTKAANYTYPFTPSELITIRELFNDISGYTLSKMAITDILFYYPSSNCVVSNGMDRTPEFYYKSQQIGNEEMYHRWYSMISDKNSTGFISIPLEKNNIFYFKYIPMLPSAYTNRPVVLVKVDIEKLLDFETSNYQAYLVNKNNEVIAHSKSGDMDTLQKIGIDKIGKYNNVSTSYGTNRYILCQSELESFGLQYVCLFDKKDYFRQLMNMRVNMIVLLVIALILGWYIIRYVIRENKKPIETIIQKLKSYNPTFDSKVNELQYIDSVVADALRENEKYSNDIFKQKRYLIDNVLNKLAKGTFDESNIDMLESMGVKFQWDHFLVLSFFIESFANIYFEEGEETVEKLNQAQFIISNIIEELLSEDFSVYFFNSNIMPICIVNLKGSANDYKEQIKQIVSNINEFILKNFNFEFVMGISNIHRTMKGIHVAYDESIEALEQRFIKEDVIIDYEEIHVNAASDYYYPTEKEELIITGLMAGNYNTCKEQLDEIFKVNFEKYHLSLAYARILMMDIMSTFIKTINKFNNVQDTKLIQNMDVFDRINKCDHIHDAKEQIYLALKEFCDYTKENIIDTSSDLVSNIVQFVNDYYWDEKINVAMVSEHFNLHPNYLSGVFKKQMNVGLLEYISNTRINKAKELIKSTDYSIELISQKVGVSNSRTFFRMFSKYVGVSPGKYREMKDQ